MEKSTSSLIILLLLASILLAQPALACGRTKNSDEVTLTLIGRVVNAQGAGVDGAEVRIFIGGAQRTLMVAGEETEIAQTHPDGSYTLDLALPRTLIETETLAVAISRPGFRTTRQGFGQREFAHSGDHCYVRVPDVVLPRAFNPAFFLATAIFLVVFGFITLNLLHETISALLGVAAMLGVSYFLGNPNADFWIIGFHRAITFSTFYL